MRASHRNLSQCYETVAPEIRILNCEIRFVGSRRQFSGIVVSGIAGFSIAVLWISVFSIAVFRIAVFRIAVSWIAMFRIVSKIAVIIITVSRIAMRLKMKEIAKRETQRDLNLNSQCFSGWVLWSFTVLSRSLLPGKALKIGALSAFSSALSSAAHIARKAIRGFHRILSLFAHCWSSLQVLFHRFEVNPRLN